MKKRILNWVKPAFVCLLCAVMLCEIGLTAFAESEGEVMLSNLAGQSGAYELNPITGEFEAAMHPEFFDMEPEDVPPSGIFPEEIEPRSESVVVDDREPVYYPSGTSGTTCRIAGRYGSGADDLNKGTGWLLNKQFLLTSAHVVYRYGVGPCSHVGIYVGASGENHYKEYRLGTSCDRICSQPSARPLCPQMLLILRTCIHSLQTLPKRSFSCHSSLNPLAIRQVCPREFA